MNKHFYWLTSIIPVILWSIYILFSESNTKVRFNFWSLVFILILIFAFSFYKLIKDEEIRKSVIYYFSYGILTVLITFVILLTQYEITKPNAEYDGLGIIIYSLLVMACFFGTGLVVLIFKELNKRFKKL
ncbi:hypothetical protein J4405_01565 [Candidatus Woesearchaeota archaeon]|nr:hypothetical protein [Candidatus Woesearchaeota archaeon]